MRVYLFCFFEIFYARVVVSLLSLSLSLFDLQKFSLVRSLPFSLVRSFVEAPFLLAGTRPLAEKDADN